MNLLKDEKLNEKTSVALGFFDGLHIAHRRVIDRVLNKANSCVMTFKTEGFSDKTLMSDETKLEMLESLGVRFVVFLDFIEVKDLSPESFVREILVEKLNAEFVACGYNFRFGKNAQGSARDLLKICGEFGIKTEIVDEFDSGGNAVSTTRIKSLLKEGKVKEASTLLGYRYFIEDTVIHGRKLGREYDFPTANQRIEKGRFTPKFGVYASRVTADGKTYIGVTNIGVKPTVSDEKTVLCETYLQGYNGDLYGKIIRVELVEFIREEKKFTDVSALFEQIKSDKQKAISLLTKGGYNG